MEKNNKQEEKKLIQEEIAQFKAIETIADMEGGKIISKGLRQELATTIDIIANSYRELSHIELISLCAAMSSNLKMIRLMKRAKKNKDILLEELETSFKEEDEG